MRHLLITSLHVFVIVMLSLFIIGGIMAITGSFDHWTARYKLKLRRKRLLRAQYKKAPLANNKPHASSSNAPFFVYKGKYWFK